MRPRRDRPASSLSPCAACRPRMRCRRVFVGSDSLDWSTFQESRDGMPLHPGLGELTPRSVLVSSSGGTPKDSSCVVSGPPRPRSAPPVPGAARRPKMRPRGAFRRSVRLAAPRGPCARSGGRSAPPRGGAGAAASAGVRAPCHRCPLRTVSDFHRRARQPASRSMPPHCAHCAQFPAAHARSRAPPGTPPPPALPTLQMMTQGAALRCSSTGPSSAFPAPPRCHRCVQHVRSRGISGISELSTPTSTSPRPVPISVSSSEGLKSTQP